MYEDKTESYYSICRTDLLKHVPAHKSNKVLEIGAGSGETLLKAKEYGLAEFVAGVDLSEIANSKQTHAAMDRFIIGNIEHLQLDFEEKFFDVIICGDVLEHLIDPWQCLLRLRPFLRDGGVFIASIPNVRYWKVSMRLVCAGRWNYCERGILDQSHLRFFVKNTMREMFERTGFSVEKMEQLGPQRKWGFLTWVLNILTFGIFSDLLTVTYIIVASKK